MFLGELKYQYYTIKALVRQLESHKCDINITLA
jgi:hypothetical protein